MKCDNCGNTYEEKSVQCVRLYKYPQKTREDIMDPNRFDAYNLCSSKCFNECLDKNFQAGQSSQLKGV